MAGNEKLDEEVARFVADVLCKMVGNEISVPQAVRMVDSFMEGLKGRLPEETWLKSKPTFCATSSRYRRSRRADAAAARGDKRRTPPTPGGRNPSVWRNPIISVQEYDEVPMWEAIKRNLPQSLQDDPKTPWRIGFLLGVGGESIVWRAMRWLWKLP